MLARMPAELIHAPWLARPVDLAAAGVEIGRDYPAPIVHHDAARAKTLARYAAVKARQVAPQAAFSPSASGALVCLMNSCAAQMPTS